jgi:hypothetical protein
MSKGRGERPTIFLVEEDDEVIADEMEWPINFSISTLYAANDQTRNKAGHPSR